MSTETKHSSLLNDITILYLALPIAIFIIGWVNYFIAGGLTLVACYLLYKKYQNSKTDWLSELHELKSRLSIAKISKHLLIFLILAFWLIISGWGNFVYQHTDFIVRNATLGALVQEPWPVQYTPDTYFCYYFISYLPAALIGKSTSISTANYALVLYYSLGLFLALLLFKKNTSASHKFILSCLFLFGSLTLIRGLFVALFPSLDYSLHIISITQQIALTAHQAIPVLLISLLIVSNYTTSKNFVFLLMATLCYSPLCALAVCLIILTIHYKEFANSIKEKKYPYFSLYNGLSFVIGFIFFVFMSNNSSAQGSFSIQFPYNETGFWFYFLTSFLIYSLLLPLTILKQPIIVSSIIITLITPIIYIGCDINDFLCKSTLVSTTIILYYVIKETCNHSPKKYTFIILLIIGCAPLSTPLGLYLSCDDSVIALQEKVYDNIPNSYIKNIFKKKTYNSSMCHQNKWGASMYHPNHRWNNNFIGGKNNITNTFFRFN